ncbi:sulfatase-like hydrolase/transferase [Pseudoteredinibacter isoporae]|uniref:Phosphoglycerol transferase n=1 Tax=Pseudoteredinibacter isoporae TaxID=570281 RepID=A0A7X0JRK2_9GAMM|nr:sulfatase-like hydrolase/transferase [Pseudoteredinibacter isoporae]MBB6520101.1 phosphoglycerol transferase [Pseudoteredinibacter isoporae]NHO85673.1 sulfatase-like hydrolase/transferase [Pseudoteredinibacter isoporae]NIB25875.1 sulfatase-like hydrolase/transferase [Pseudoteredinibacter isoporae]
MPSFILITSVLLFVIALGLSIRFTLNKKTRIACFLLAMLWVILSCTFFVADYFSGNGIDEATVYHMQYGLGGAGFGEYSRLILVSSLGLAAIVGLLIYAFFFGRKPEASKTVVTLMPASLFAALLCNPASLDLYRVSGLDTAPAASDFHQYYQKPELSASRNHTKNIVYIYAESLEQNYFDETLFPDLMPKLKALSAESSLFTNIHQVYGTGWTIAGIAASQCGISLVTPSHGNSMSGMPEFLPGATCLGDLLSKEGYQLNFMGGAQLKFAGKGKFLKNHGFSTIKGLNHFKKDETISKNTSAWGLYDDQLLTLVREEFQQLQDQNKPFGLFALTLDTHHPKGHISKSCRDMRYRDGSNAMLNAVHCTDALLSDFIESIRALDKDKNTVIVLASDHLALKNLAWDTLKQKPRKNFLMIIDPEQKGQIINTEGSPLDIAPTLLSAVGYEANMGLGKNLFDTKLKTAQSLNKKLPSWRDDFLEFWEFPQLYGHATIDLPGGHISFANRDLKIPVLIEVKPNLRTIARFQFDRSAGHQSFVDHISEIPPGSHFLWIDSCKNMPSSSEKAPKGSFCLSGGKPGKINTVKTLSPKERLSIKELRNLMGMKS